MTNLTYKQHENNGIEVIIEHPTGAAFYSIRGYARLSGLTKQAISKRYQGVNQSDKKSAETLTIQGLQRVNLIPALTAFRWALKDNQKLAYKMGECGATVYAYQLAGIQVKAVDPFPQENVEVDPLVSNDPAFFEIHQFTQSLMTIGIDLKKLSHIEKAKEMLQTTRLLYHPKHDLVLPLETKEKKTPVSDPEMLDSCRNQHISELSHIQVAMMLKYDPATLKRRVQRGISKGICFHRMCQEGDRKVIYYGASEAWRKLLKAKQIRQLMTEYAIDFSSELIG